MCSPRGQAIKYKLENCSDYFNRELENLKQLKVIVTLGKIAFDNFIKNYKKNYTISTKYKFKHVKSIFYQIIEY